MKLVCVKKISEFLKEWAVVYICIEVKTCYEAVSVLPDGVHRPTEFSQMYTCDFDTVLLYFASRNYGLSSCKQVIISERTLDFI